MFLGETLWIKLSLGILSALSLCLLVQLMRFLAVTRILRFRQMLNLLIW